MYAHNEFDPGRAAGMAAAPEKLVAAGAISASKRDTEIAITQASDQAMTLAAGTEGAEKVIVMTLKSGVGNAVITPTSFQDGTTITMNTVGDVVILKFIGAKWHVVLNKGATVA